jgi:hypothetical protein
MLIFRHTLLIQNHQVFFGTVCTKTIIQLNHTVMGSLGLMSCGSRNLIHTTGAVLSMKYKFCEDLEDSNI